MPTRNQTTVMEFILLGFGNLHYYNITCFLIFFLIFLFTLIGNHLIIVLVLLNSHLHSPMYYFLSHLSFSDLLLTTNTVPHMLGSILQGGMVMTYNGCITQFYFFSATTITECFILTVMSYDRYLAICNPLRYSTIMDCKQCVCLSLWPWLLGFTLNMIAVVPVSNFNFCHDNVINHFYCDLLPLQKLSCSDTSLVELEVFVFSLPIFILPCVFITVTYVYIFLTVYRITSTSGKQKALSTCSSHLIVVGTFYGTLIAKYMIPSTGHSLLINKILSLLHTVFTPLCNPIIYSLRNQDIRMALRKATKACKA